MIDINNEKWNAAVRELIDELESPDEEFRQKMHDQEIYNEFWWVRRSLIEHLHTLWH